MKKLIITVVGLIAVIVLVLIVAAMNAQRLATRFKPQIERAASSALGSNVTLGDIKVSVLPSVRLMVDETRIAPPNAPREHGLRLNNLTLNLRLLPLLRQEFEIETLSLDRPAVTLVRTAQGVEVEGLPKQEAAPQPEKPAPQPPGEAASSAPPALNLSLRHFKLSDGVVTFKDRVAGKEYTVKQLDVSASLDATPERYLLDSVTVNALALEKVDLSLQGKRIAFAPQSGALELPELAITLLKNSLQVQGAWNTKSNEGRVAVSSTGIDLQSLAPLSEIAPAVAQLNLGGEISIPKLAVAQQGQSVRSSGTITLKGVRLDSPPHEIRALNGELKVQSSGNRQEISSDDLALQLNGAPIKSSLHAVSTGKELQIEKLVLDAFSGTLSVRAQLNQGAAGQPFSSKVGAKGLDIAPLLSAALPQKPVPLVGTMSELELQAGGALANVKESIKGDGKLAVTKATLKGINLAGEVLRSVRDLPFVSGRLDSLVPPNLRGVIESPDTEIDSLTAAISFGEQRVQIRSLELVSRIFALTADGTAGFDSVLDLHAAIRFSPEFSASLAASKKEIQRFLNERGELVIPLAIKGVPPKLLVVPDISRFLQGAGKEAIREEAGKLLDRALRGKRGQSLGRALGF